MVTFIITSIIIGIGLVSLILPVLPGTAIVFAGILFHKLMLGEASVTWQFIAFALSLTILAHLIDFLGSLWGARYFGATWTGALGSLFGAFIGFLFFNLMGLLIGPIIGVFLFERLKSDSTPVALRASFGTIIGTIAAFFAKTALTLIIIFAFFSSTITS